MTDGEVRQKWDDGIEEVRRPCGDIAHHTGLQESLYKSLFLQRLHLRTVVANGRQPAEQRRRHQHQDTQHLHMHLKTLIMRMTGLDLK